MTRPEDSYAKVPTAKSHPLYHDTVGRYMLARRAWNDSPSVREAAYTLGIGERAYCDAFVAGATPLTFTWDGSTLPKWQHVCDAAYVEAGARLTPRFHDLRTGR